MSAATPPPPAALLFIYGTLKRGGSNHHYLRGQHLLGPARTASGWALYSLGRYPGMVPAPAEERGVTGELWAVDAACLAALDELEGLAEGEYSRIPLSLAQPHADLAVQTYRYLRPLTHARRLGDTWPVDSAAE
jgi:gamma-glutamylaminecyclotransferase